MNQNVNRENYLSVMKNDTSFCFLCMVAGEAESPSCASELTRVAAEGQFACGCVGLRDVEIPVLVNAHGGSVGVPAGVGEEQVLEARQHLRATGANPQSRPKKPRHNNGSH